jgi:hypothetical protein
LPMFLYRDEKVRIDNGRTSLENLIMMRQSQVKDAQFMLEHWKKEPGNGAVKQSELARWKDRIDCLELALQTLERIKK